MARHIDSVATTFLSKITSHTPEKIPRIMWSTPVEDLPYA